MNLNFYLILLVTSILLYFCIVNLIFQVRKRFSISVNCWFCNSRNNVKYEDSNKFTCKDCIQYNGWDDSGNYNCITQLRKQQNSKLNSNYYALRNCQKSRSNNGFCTACNRNQEMFVIQLANFKPKSEQNFDKEIEEYKKKLEDSYQLCQSCVKVLKKKLNSVKTKFIGSKTDHLVKRGTKHFQNNSTKSYGQLMLTISILLLSVGKLFSNSNMNFNFLPSEENVSYFTADQFIQVPGVAHIIALKMTITDIFKAWMKQKELNRLLDIKLDAVALFAIILLLCLLKQVNIRKYVIISLLLWSLNIIASETSSINQFYFLLTQKFLAILLIIASSSLVKLSRNQKVMSDQNTSFHKLEYSDESEEEDEIPDSRCNFIINSFSSSPSSVKSIDLVQPARTLPSRCSSQFFERSLENIEVKSVRATDFGCFNFQHEITAAKERSQVYKDINRLNISGNYLGSTSTLKDFGLTNNKLSLNPFALEKSRCGSPTPSLASVFSNAHRAQTVSPLRLESSFLETKSWVGGGYWCSPKKLMLETQNIVSYGLSRSSSQSSGVGTIDSCDKNSRENSIIYEDQLSLSETVRKRNIFEQPSPYYPHSQTASKNFFLNSNLHNYRDPSTSFFK